jgi:hypothetical protein
MKIPSLSLMLSRAKETFLRFPFVIIIAAIGSFAMINLLECQFDSPKNLGHMWGNIAMTSVLGIPLFLSFGLFSEKKGHGTAVKYLFQLIPLAALLVYYFSLSGEENLYDMARFFLYIIAFHLLVSYSAFILHGEKNLMGFWDFNLRIFLQFLLSALYSGVLYAGLAIALLAFDKLFGMNIPGERYGQLFFLLAGIFNTWFFCAGVPDLKSFKPEEFSFPKGLKIFTQFVLLPIVVIYVLILYMYMFKIIFQWELPSGWVSYLVMGFSGAGIFSLLLIYPLKDNPSFKWVGIFTRWFFIALIPQIVLLFLAITARTSEYGMTERRYYVFVLAAWLAVTTVLYIFTNFKNIKYIPVSLFLIAVLSSFGPWSSFSVSLNSQLSRFDELLVKNSILKDGKAVKITKEVSDQDKEDMYSIIEFLIDRKRLDKIQPYFSENLEEVIKSENTLSISMKRIYSNPDKIMTLMGIEYEKKLKTGERDFIDISIKLRDAINIGGYSSLYPINIVESDTSKTFVAPDSSDIIVKLNKEDNSVAVMTKKDSATIKISGLLREGMPEQPELNDVTFETENALMSYKLIVTSANFRKTEGVFHIALLRAYLLTKKK